MLSDNINVLKKAIYDTFQESIHQSALSDYEKQTPPFVLEIMTQKSGDGLYYLLKSKTPYCSLFNFLKFFGRIADKLGNRDAKEIILKNKEILDQTKKNDIMPYVEKESSQKEEFTKVVLLMHKNFKIVTCEEIEHHKELVSVILSQKDLVCFVGIDEENQTVTYLIPSILTEGAYSNANKNANQFSDFGVLSITIGASKIFPSLSDSIRPYLDWNQGMNICQCFTDLEKICRLKPSPAM